MTEPAAPLPEVPGGAGAASYSERLWVPVGWWLVGAVAVFLSFVTVWVVGGPALWVPCTVVIAALIAALLLKIGSARVAVEADGFLAGPARLPLWAVGEVTEIDRAGVRRLAGVGADPRTYFQLRTYVRGAIRVDVADPDDATPYWLVSSRHADRLAQALRTAAAGHR